MPFDNKTVAPVTARMRELLGPQGEHWCRLVRTNHKQQHCLMGILDIIEGKSLGNGLRGSRNVERLAAAVRKVDIHHRRRHFYDEAAGSASVVCNYNNSADSFADIVRLLDIAAELEIEETVNAV